MMKLDTDANKKTIILVASMVACCALAFVLMQPLLAKKRRVSKELRLLDKELSDIRATLDREKTKRGQEKYLLARGEVSKAINEIVNTGTSLNINFLSNSPDAIGKSRDSQYSILPIHMKIQSTYKDLGIFLGALENLDFAIVTVRNFSVERVLEILPEIYTDLVIEVYLKEGEGG
mgnify:CR=1 FL=1